MTTLIFGNNCATTLAGAITNTATSFNVAAGGGALFPNPTGSQYFVLTLVDAATGLLNEIMWCTARSTDTFTVTRAQEGTTALNWNAGDLVQSLWTAGQAAAMQQSSAAPSSLIYYGADTGSVNAMVATVTPSIISLSTGNIFEITPAHTNTSATVTLNISSLGAQNVYRSDGSALLIGDIQTAPFKALISWDATATKFLLLNPCVWDSAPTISFSGSDTGAANAYVVTTTTPPAPAALAQGQAFRVKIGTGNSNTGGSATIQITLQGGGTTTKNITRADGSPLQAGDLAVGEIAPLIYSGSAFQLQGVLSSYAPPRNLASFTSHGSGTWTVPAGIYQIYPRGVGAGGGGGPGGGVAGSANYSGGGGASGGYFEGWLSTTPGTVINYTVGQGGAGGTTFGTAAGTGGTTTFGPVGGVTLTATGGGGGILASGTAAGGGAGSASGAQINLPGANGGDGNPLVAQIQGGYGASSAFGGGGRTATVGLPSFTGVNGIAPGSGGGGVWGTGTGSQQGGNGADGAIFINY